MRWFAGFHQRQGDPYPLPAPLGGRLLWNGPHPLWVVGRWAPWELRTVIASGHRAAVLGTCLASDLQIAEDLVSATRTGVYDLLTGWPGSYQVVIQDRRGATVTTDLAGQRPVFFVPWARGTAYASLALPLAALTSADLDRRWLLGARCCPMVPEIIGDRSVFAGITRVQHGRSLRLSAQGVRQRACSPPRPGALGLEAAAPALRSALTEAVRGRLTTAQQPTTDLSGGLDSTTVALLAAQRLRSRRGLPAFTYADAAAKTDDDLTYARSPHAVSRGCGPCAS